MKVYVSVLIVILATGLLSADEPIKTIPAGSRIYTNSVEGFSTFLAAALTKKKVPVTLVTVKEKADYELTAVTQSDKAGWARVAFLGQTGSNEEASLTLVDLKTSEIVYSYSVHKRNSVRGKQSSAEACAKHLKKVVK